MGKMSRQINLLRWNDSQKSSSNKQVIGQKYNIHNDELVPPTASITIREYLRQSTIHGLKFLLEPHWWQKMFWIVAIVICSAMAGYFSVKVRMGNLKGFYVDDWSSILVYQVFLKWRREPIYLAFDTQSTPIYRVPFPAITVCNMNQVNFNAVNAIYDVISGDNSSGISNRMIMHKAGLLQGMCDEIDFGLELSEVMHSNRTLP